MKLLTAVCDDDSSAARDTAALAESLCPPGCGLKTECFYGPAALLDAVRCDNYRPQLAILDIDMPGMDGIALARELSSLLPECRIIFISAYQDFASDVYTAEHVWFLYKPTAAGYFGLALEKAISSLSPQTGSTLLLKTRKLTRAVPIDEVLFIERRLHSTIVYTTGGDTSVTQHPDDLLKDVPPGIIGRCHQSYWVFFAAVSDMSGNEFTLKNGRIVPISRSCRNVRREYLDYLEKLSRSRRPGN